MAACKLPVLFLVSITTAILKCFPNETALSEVLFFSPYWDLSEESANEGKCHLATVLCVPAVFYDAGGLCESILILIVTIMNY